PNSGNLRLKSLVPGFRVFDQYGKLARKRGDLLVSPVEGPILDLQIPADNPAALAQPLQPRLRRIRWEPTVENTDAMNRLIRAGVRRAQSDACRYRGEHEAPEHRR